ncbi:MULTISPECIES: DUF2301 domain-containing membrane protein [Prochlorococcus]|uniref:DUF2301 domain-containing membrane protein n=1 Tax=Prochlorococcus TaxID=1218 RepID=UPI0005337340|nr:MULTISPECIES: DUF2301 domain-containing membrane protein [Prochlorococcus]KGG13146.1 hypothetical protein EV05_0824 [Prochlorococcus sp. MIT 0601]
MNKPNLNIIGSLETVNEPVLQGIYGSYTITLKDQIEVQRYRISVLVLGLSFCLGLLHWFTIGPESAWLWLIPMSISLGLALKWIHIYIVFLHQSLKILWGIGCMGFLLLLFYSSPQNLLEGIASTPKLELIIGPFFAALTGLGFKEFFCFRRPEAIGLTLFLPLSLLGHLFGFFSLLSIASLLGLSAVLLLIMGWRKFGLESSLDVGDKSVFEYLQNQKEKNVSSI